jgi:hypothetical protein
MEIRKIAAVTMIIMFFLAFSMILLWIIINLIGGCESWNNEQWTSTKSCIGFTEMFEVKK